MCDGAVARGIPADIPVEACGVDGEAMEERDGRVGDAEFEGRVVGKGREEGEGVGLRGAGVHEFGVAGAGAVGERFAGFNGAEELVGPADVLGMLVRAVK